MYLFINQGESIECVSLTVNKLSSGIEETFAHLSEELRKSCFCPRCKKDNMEALDNTLQVNDEGN